MTQKELLYLEDAIGHERNIISILQDTIERLKDKNLITFLDNELNITISTKENLMNKLKEKANG